MSRCERIWRALGGRRGWLKSVEEAAKARGEESGKVIGAFEGKIEGHRTAIFQAIEMIVGATKLMPHHQAERKRERLQMAEAIKQIRNPFDPVQEIKDMAKKPDPNVDGVNRV